MLRLLCIIAIVFVLNNGAIVRSGSPPFCGYSSKTSTCPGDHVKVRHPFWIENRTTDEYGDCISYPGFQVKCAANGRPIINISNSLYSVLGIYNYQGLRSLTVVNVDIDAQECPQPRRNISINSAPFLTYYEGDKTVKGIIFYNCSRYSPNVVQHMPCLDKYYTNSSGRRSFAFTEEEISTRQFDWYGNCEEAVVVPGLDSAWTSTNYTEALKLGISLDWEYPVNCENCELSGGKCWANETIKTTPFHCNCPIGATLVDNICSGSYYDSYRGIAVTDSNYLYCGNCELSGGKCWVIRLTNKTNQFHCNCPDGTTQLDPMCFRQNVAGMSIRLKIIIGASAGVGGLLLLGLLIIFRTRVSFILAGATAGEGGLLLSLLILLRRKCYPLCYPIVSWCRTKIKGPATNVELFLENNYGCLSLQNYKYSNIMKMTNSFKDTLGQGGYGRVFKGNLRDGRSVAVKVLNESKGKGEDFINEVATIGRTNHVNVVSLLGFCADGTKRALVYEFMPNGSLEKFIHNAKDSSTTSSFLGWDKLFQIALGIARGLEYLHRGCNTRILHFDIKPHNILLDEDFCPKIADFGLAKLCPTRESLVSMVDARGTIGYIAPEVCCRNFGGVSYKSDVYSYGMMVLEMIGGRKNIDATVENLSEIYFPQWIYRRLRDDIKVEGSEKRKVVVCGEVFAEDVTQKMIIVALWCIQAHPGDRPSMTKVVEMLEGNTEDLQHPPNPFPDPSSKPFPTSS